MTRRLLFITSTRIGDAVLSTGLLRHVIEQDPALRVTVACGPPAAPLFEAVPGLEKIIVVAKKRHSRHWIDLWTQVAGTRWSQVIDLRRSALAWLLPLARRRAVLPKAPEPMHRVKHIAMTLGLQANPPAPHLWTAPQHEARAAALIPDGAPVLALGPTANWRAKTWRAAHFADLVGCLTAPDGILPGARVALFGGPDERAQAAPVIDAVPEDRRIDLVGRIDLLTAHACLQRCAFYVGNDSALMHVAAAAGVPTLGLFGPTQEVYYAPWGTHTAVVRTTVPFAEIFPPGFDHRTSESLMDTLTVDMAADAAARLWKDAYD